MSIKKNFLLVCILFILPLSGLTQGKVKHWTLKDAMKINDISNLSFSPNQQYLTYTLEKNILTSKGIWIRSSQIHLVNLQKKTDIILTRKGNKYSNPKWSFDGKYIAYTFQRANDPMMHLWVMKSDGTEKRQITENTTPITSFAWSINRYAIAYVTQLHYPVSKAEDKNNRPVDVNNTFDYSDLHLIELKNNKPMDRRLTSGFKKRYKFNIVTWKKNGKGIVFSQIPSNRHDVWDIGKLMQFNLTAMKAKPMLIKSENLPVQDAMYSNDNKKLALFSSGIIYNMDINKGKLTKLATDHGELFTNIIGWSHNNQKIYALEKYHTYYRILALSTNGRTYNVVSLPHKMITLPTLAQDSHTLAFGLQDSNQPVEIFLSSIQQPKPEQVTHINPVLKHVLWGKTKVIHWKSVDGLVIEGLLTYPKNYQSNHQYPLLVELHGGPGSSFVQRYVARKSVFPIANFSADGYFYFRPNVRGSSGYGSIFKHLNQKDWGGLDYQDVIFGVQSLIQKGLIKKDKIGVLGWSYGGYLAAWAISHSPLFKAASIGGGIVNLVSYTGTNDLPNNFLPQNLGNYFWDDKTLYIDRSPIFYVNQIHAPVLLEYGENDQRVPKSQGYELYHALKILNVPTTLLIYPNTEHSIKDPNLLFQSAQKNLAWFQYYLNHSNIMH